MGRKREPAKDPTSLREESSPEQVAAARHAGKQTRNEARDERAGGLLDFPGADTGDESRALFLAALSHELRSPLNTIRLWSQILQHPGRSAEDMRKGLEAIDRSTRAQARLIDELLDVYRISSGSLQLALAEFDLRELLSAVVDGLQPDAADKGVRLCQESAPDPIRVCGDSPRLRQVFGNLLDNAIKFTPQGGEVRIALREADGRAELDVSDTGRGIEPADVPYLFEWFRRNAPRSGQGGGLGLGLFLAKHVVALHGGTLSVQSAGKDQGSTFTVSLASLRPNPRTKPRS